MSDPVPVEMKVPTQARSTTNAAIARTFDATTNSCRQRWLARRSAELRRFLAASEPNLAESESVAPRDVVVSPPIVPDVAIGGPAVQQSSVFSAGRNRQADAGRMFAGREADTASQVRKCKHRVRQSVRKEESTSDRASMSWGSD